MPNRLQPKHCEGKVPGSEFDDLRTDIYLARPVPKSAQLYSQGSLPLPVQCLRTVPNPGLGPHEVQTAGIVLILHVNAHFLHI